MRICRVMLLCIFAASSAFANTVAVFPCPSKPTAAGVCPAVTMPAGQTPTIGADDYYDLYIESTCIDQPDSWWNKKLVEFTVTVTIGSNKPISVPVFADRAIGAGCHIGVNSFPIMTSIPSNGQNLALKVSVMRSDETDGLKQILSFATTTSQNPSLSTYAASAIPYMGLAIDIANTAYSAFGQSLTPWLDTTETALHPVSATGPDRFDLQAGYLVQYSGSDNPSDKEFYVDSGELKWSANDTPVRGGSTWVLFKVEKYSRRNDYPTRVWYQDWEKLLQDTISGSVAADAFKTRYQQVITLLQSDPDFTSGDKLQYVRSFSSVRDSIVAELAKPSPDYAAIGNAVTSSQVTARQAQMAPNGKWITAVNSSLPVITIPSTGARSVIVPSKLANALVTTLKP